jgi:hypothetical protein
MIFLRAEGRKRKMDIQAVCKNQLILNTNVDAMKPLLALLLFVFSFPVLAQQRNSEKATEKINFTSNVERKAVVGEYINARTAYYGAANEKEPLTMRLYAKKIPLKTITPFLSFFCTWEETDNDGHNTIVNIRFSTNNQNWTNWEQVKTDEHVNETPGRFIGQLRFRDKEYQYYQVEIITNNSGKGKLLTNFYLNFFSAGEEQKVSGRITPQTQTANRTAACPVSQPAFVNRIGWGCTQVWSPSSTTVTHLIVHHAAGTNTSSDWGAVVLGIWNFHTTPTVSGGAGYSDIGYNWLIAPNGVLYEGRYNSSVANIQGAHFCGTNQNTMGVCMLGDYTNITITTAARNTLTQVLAWKACERSIDPLTNSLLANTGVNYNHISGHRDGCATQCPGNTFYPDLPGVRIDVNNIMNGTTPVTTIEGVEEFSITPNPVTTTAILTLKLNTVKEIQYRIISADGRIIYQSTKQKVSGVWREEVKVMNRLAPAAYTLQLWVNEEMVSRQLIKQ